MLLIYVVNNVFIGSKLRREFNKGSKGRKKLVLIEFLLCVRFCVTGFINISRFFRLFYGKL